MIRKAFWIILFLSVSIIGMVSFRPVPIPDSEYDLRIYSGQLDSLLARDSQDIIIFLKNSDKNFYINRGLENEDGQLLWEMKEELKGKTIEVGYPDYWTILDPTNSTRHVSVLKYEGQTLYTEIKNSSDL